MAEDKNIFETAAKKLGKNKGKQPSGPVPLKPVADKDPTPTPNRPIIPSLPRDPQTQAMLNKIRTMQADLQQRFELLYKTAKMSAEEFKAYLANPKNFSKKDWEFVQKNKNILEVKVWDTVGTELKPSTSGRKRENLDQERKGKTLGARKKWIPMK